MCVCVCVVWFVTKRIHTRKEDCLWDVPSKFSIFFLKQRSETHWDLWCMQKNKSLVMITTSRRRTIVALFVAVHNFFCWHFWFVYFCWDFFLLSAKSKYKQVVNRFVVWKRKERWAKAEWNWIESIEKRRKTNDRESIGMIGGDTMSTWTNKLAIKEMCGFEGGKDWVRGCWKPFWEEICTRMLEVNSRTDLYGNIGNQAQKYYNRGLIRFVGVCILRGGGNAGEPVRKSIELSEILTERDKSW